MLYVIDIQIYKFFVAPRHKHPKEVDYTLYTDLFNYEIKQQQKNIGCLPNLFKFSFYKLTLSHRRWRHAILTKQKCSNEKKIVKKKIKYVKMEKWRRMNINLARLKNLHHKAKFYNFTNTCKCINFSIKFTPFSSFCIFFVFSSYYIIVNKVCGMCYEI